MFFVLVLVFKIRVFAIKFIRVDFGNLVGNINSANQKICDMKEDIQYSATTGHWTSTIYMCIHTNALLR